jgi:hypothetical protein
MVILMAKFKLISNLLISAKISANLIIPILFKTL